MADYKTAIKRILQHEGGYVNDPTDSGGETYKGISRKNWPKWTGWAFVDQAKTKGWPLGNEKFDNDVKSHILSKISGLNDSVIAFYKREFWDKIGGDMIASQTIANNLVDAAVNEGIRPAVKRAEKIVLMAESGVFSPELAEKLGALV